MNTIDIIKTTIQADMKQELEGIRVHDAIIEALKGFEGKKVSKRLANAAQEALPEYRVLWRAQYGMFYIDVCRKGNPYPSDLNLSFLIAYDCEPTYREGKATISHSGFRYYSTCYGNAARERNFDRAKLLDSDKLQEMAQDIDEYKRLKNKMDSYYNPSWYSIEKATGLKK